MTICQKTNCRINNSSMVTDCHMDFSSPTFRRKQEKRELVEMSIVNSTNFRTKNIITLAMDHRPSLSSDLLLQRPRCRIIISNVHCIPFNLRLDRRSERTFCDV